MRLEGALDWVKDCVLRRDSGREARVNCQWQRLELGIASEEKGELMPEDSLSWVKGERQLKGVLGWWQEHRF